MIFADRPSHFQGGIVEIGQGAVRVELQNRVGIEPGKGGEFADFFLSPFAVAGVTGDDQRPLGFAVFIKDEIASKGATDSTTFTSSKNDDPHSAWGWTTGNVPAKDDLSNVYLYATTDPVVGDLILYAGLERLDPGGDSHVDIEINQNPIDLDEQPSPRNAPGPDEYAVCRHRHKIQVSQNPLAKWHSRS